MDNFDDQVCKECIAVGEYTGDDPSQVAKLLGCNRTNEIQIKRAGTKYRIEIEQIVNRKIVKIIADSNVSLDRVYSLLMEILRFENLYEGIFFMFTSFKVDGAECIEKYRKLFLNYTHSNKQYVMLPMDLDDQTYKKLFLKSQKVIKKAFLRHQAFLNALFVNDLTVDVRMSLILEVFESLVNEMASNGEITLKAQPYRIYTNPCPKCGAIVTRKDPNKKVYLVDKIYAVMNEYGKDIFVGDSKTKIARKSKNLRNKIDHISKQKNGMQGEQAGFYLHKFGLMYRIIILKMIDGYNDEIQRTVNTWTVAMNNSYASYRILP